MDTNDITNLLERTAAAIITPRFRSLGSVDVMSKGNANELVTVADREAEAFIKKELNSAFPKALVVGEESVFEHPELLEDLAAASHAFVIDPIDGTRNYVQGRIEHGVMVAELRDGTATRGWIYQPQTQRAYVGVLGQGVTLNGAPLVRTVVERPPLGATSKRHLHGFTGDGVLSPVVNTRFACAFDYPRVLHGELDFVNYTKSRPWDHLAGALMITELGGEVRTLDGQLYTVASPDQGLIGAASPQILDLVRSCWPLPNAASPQ